MIDLTTNIEIKEVVFLEFVKILLPELQGKKVIITHISLEDGKEVEIKIELPSLGIESTFKFENLTKILKDQKIVMAKVGLLKALKKDLPWGGLIGVRPTKLLRKLLREGFDFDQASHILKELYLVSDRKIELLVKVVKKELIYLNRDHINLYIGIPYCPTKCRYCSFASYEKKGKIGTYYDEFVKTLLEEISLTGEFLKRNRDRVSPIESLYIGGGTPSILTEKDTESILKAIWTHLPLENLKEFTLEAGRVDTLTKKKLDIMKKYKVERISLNPQTFNLETLKKMNRPLDIDKFNLIYNYSKELGFLINMDLIIGLPGEETKDILDTFKTIEKYDIDNLTTHILALKKSSLLYKDEEKEIKPLDFKVIEEGLYKLTEKKKMNPYYMYRQKNSMDWGENLGFATEGNESIFNIEMIEENQSTLGLGGGAITKFITSSEDNDQDKDQIKRLVSPKEPIAYIREMEDRLVKKLDLFYNKK